MARIEITKDAVLQPGDIIELEYKVIGPVWLKAVQIAVIESKLEKNPRFFLQSYRFEGENDRTLIMEIMITAPRADQAPEIQEAGVPVTVIIVAVAGAAGALFVWLSLSRIYKIVQTPGGAVSVGMAGAAAAGLLIFFLLKRS